MAWTQKCFESRKNEKREKGWGKRKVRQGRRGRKEKDKEKRQRRDGKEGDRGWRKIGNWDCLEGKKVHNKQHHCIVWQGVSNLFYLFFLILLILRIDLSEETLVETGIIGPMAHPGLYNNREVSNVCLLVWLGSTWRVEWPLPRLQCFL